MSSLIFLAFNKDPHLVIYVPVCLYLTLLYGWVYQYIDIKLCHSCYILAKMEPSDFWIDRTMELFSSQVWCTG